jgi:hypothetical protein
MTPDSSKLEFRLEPQTKILRKIKELGDALGGALGAAIDRLEQAVRRQGILLLNRDPAAGVQPWTIRPRWRNRRPFQVFAKSEPGTTNAHEKPG